MRRLSALERLVVVALFGLWAALFGVSLKAQLQDVGVSPLFVEPGGPGGYPVFVGMRPPVQAGGSGLRPGDVLRQLGERDLRGADRMDVLASVPDQAHGRDTLPVVYERDGERREGMLPLGSHRIYLPVLPVSAAVALVALLGALRIRPTPLTRLGFLGFMAAAIELATFALASETLVRVVLPIHLAAATVSVSLLLRFGQRFPDGREVRGLLWRLLPWLFLHRGVVVSSIALGTPLPPSVSIPATGLSALAFLVAGAWVVVHNYRTSDAIGRRQMRWVLFGVLAASLPGSVAFPLAVWDPQQIAWAFVAVAAYALVPVAVLVAIARYNLFDVDRLLTATASYQVLLLALIAGLLLLVPRMAEATAGAIGANPPTTQAMLSILLVAALVPVQRPLRAGVERLFFREQVRTEEALAELAQSLSGCADARELFTRLGEGLLAVLRPTACAIYAPDGAALSPVVARGHALPPAIERDGPLFGTLARRSEPLALGVSARADGGAPLGPFERAALEALGAEAVLPLRRAGELAAVVCLGEKRSGDVYTPTDLAWLRTLGDRATVELDRFDQRRILAESRSMQEQLRRYVPGAVADELAEGREIEAGEREVTVLFVDIRGYTAFSEGRGAAEIFSTVNAYTEKVSHRVREHGGAVVEFNGDGMMAVFGAPRPLPHKETAAVAAGRAILAAMDDVDGGRLRVGIGIATGPAFVGNIRAADRFIWSAIGNTTNLAARLQALTRDLGAAMVVDEATFAAAGAGREGLEPTGPMPVRGRREPLRLYATA